MDKNNIKKQNIYTSEEENTLDWIEIQTSFKKSFGNEIYSSWLEKISLVKEFNDYIVLSVPTRFFRDWIVSRYLDKILEQVKNFKPSLNRIEFKIVEDNKINLDNKVEEINKVSEIKDSILNYNRLNNNLNFDNFIQGKSNDVALSYSKKVCEHISRYNPLYICGGVGLGKTHLLNAIGLKLQPENNVMFISAERFMYHFIKSIKKNDMVNFKDFFRKSSVFIIDDIQFIRGKESLQEEFFHTFNSLIDKGSQIIISADRNPTKLDRVQERIKSRLAGGLVVDIEAPDLDLKIKIIKQKIIEMQNQFKEAINLSDEVINYIANESKTSIRELIGILNRVVAFSRVHNKNLTVSDCRNILKDVFSQIKVITVDKIQNVVSNYFNIPLSEMLSQRRSRPLARPRQLAMYLAKKMTTRSLPEIGRRFANRDHTTVIHAVKTISRLSEQDDEMKKNINQIKNLLQE
ncbi:MAG: chromosomal replication initiator protein DnaA [Candidatus Pelagibacter sp. TMED272]|nr:chromosomal replication initiator protein DnaA [Pelagibacteraceae bacterium]RPG93496.1 MAG: chromosomal replication initiator protein DnaA [Candidatus Pelagibacter sp. TMED272]|tara:strand:+ start:7959 stop:9344 length:1386 start_codon:yes stop_codon:yes gene_type:complete